MMFFPLMDYGRSVYVYTYHLFIYFSETVVQHQTVFTYKMLVGMAGNNQPSLDSQ